VCGIGAILIVKDPAPSLNAVSRDKKSASVRQILTRFDPDKKTAVHDCLETMVFEKLFFQLVFRPLENEKAVAVSNSSCLKRVFENCSVFLTD